MSFAEKGLERNSGALPAMSIVLMILIGFAFAKLAAILGLIALTYGFYFLIVFPLLQGLLGGAGVVIGVRVGRCRNATAAGLIGLLCGLWAYAGMYWFHHLWQLYRDAQYNGENLSWVFSTAFQWEQFKGFMALVAQEGYTIKKAHVTGLGFWIIGGIELVMAGGVGFLLPWASAKEPYCEGCRKWYTNKAVGYGALEQMGTAQLLIHNRSWAELGALCSGPENKGPAIFLTLKRCPQCASAGYLTMSARSVDKRKKQSVAQIVKEFRLSPEEVNTLLAGIAAGGQGVEKR